MNITIRHETRPLVTLALVHVLCGLVLGHFVESGRETLLLAIYIGLVFSQTSLAGIWGGLATYRWPNRFAGVTIGIGYIFLQFCFSLEDWDVRLFLLVFLSTASVAAVFLVVRRLLARLEKSAEMTTAGTAEGLQFSIRHLMLLTLVVACMLTIGKWLQPYLQGADDLAFLITISLCFVCVGITSVWAMLGQLHLILRSSVVLGIAVLTACIPAYFMERGDFWAWSTMMTVEAICLLGSLFVVRLCGFRLVRISYGQKTMKDSAPTFDQSPR